MKLLPYWISDAFLMKSIDGSYWVIVYKRLEFKETLARSGLIVFPFMFSWSSYFEGSIIFYYYYQAYLPLK